MVTIGPRAVGWLLALLFLSLAANVFVGGIAAGRYFGAARESRQAAEPAAAAGERAIPAALRRMMDAVPAEDRPAFVAALAARRPQIAAAGRELRAARERLRGLLAADTLDRQALEAAFEAVRARSGELQHAVQLAAADALARLPADTRRRIVAAQPVRPLP
ncbi:MAG: periplasmic heavy metal sensor [Rhodospirillales bacterium]